ncbi:MAG: DUF1002 domain-containing protein [Methanosphaera sp.]|uniref:DUF1002 domain-containing protein n=1 Tax=Methanosphaera sp. TaxID=2666342 RepID=UPI002606C425|nr:DUF1002 domain-containing protein [Methanosphaera sp.]MDD6534433.1 DUF1002 domain-containing protein [Methanosphaera sp.]
MGAGKIIGVVLVVFIIFGLFVPPDSVTNIISPNSSSSGGDDIAITYGQTTYDNANYKDIVDDYFKSKTSGSLSNVKDTIITANDVNKITSDISGRTYNENQILSCAMVDLNKKGSLKVDVDDSKITLVTESMYKSALNSSGISEGYVVVTSPTTATGESALAGVMKSYEKASGKEIPDELKDAANKEIYTQTQVVNESNVSADDVADVVSEAKQKAAEENTTDKNTIINIITNITENKNINITNSSVDNIADSVSQSQSVQDQANNYQSQISNYVNSDDGQTLFAKIWDFINSIINPSKVVDTSSDDIVLNNSSSNSTN